MPRPTTALEAFAAAFLTISTGTSAALAQPSGAAIASTCTLLADVATGKLLKQEGNCDKPITPASTFKIAISLMGYDSSLLKSEHVPALPFREGYADWVPEWRTSTDPTSWMKNSVVWYSQQVTRSLGKLRFKRYVAEFDYGNQDVAGDPGKQNGLTHAWLSSSLKITPLQQLDFLERMVRHQLPVSNHAYDMTTRILQLAPLSNGWEIHGKTGSGAPRRSDGKLDLDHAYGWFVGWANRDGRNVAFVRQVQMADKGTVRAGLQARDAFLAELPDLLDRL
ncbi:class D beta-lactamase [Labrys sp. KNU-23]|uniref:class D beta-lactamase n=1 Tax=Labrys sp. KNU-23 TaxID=2789216 RepID=UPI0011EC171F|nr:class D beta-lactamase [Labrys sp. KNU-23]QEN89987.1 class D beta-lactamase [Labrys sp. KNU-23]